MPHKICPICKNEFLDPQYKGKERIYCGLKCARLASAQKKNGNHPERLSDYNHKGYLSKAIIERYKGRCAICGWRASEELITVKQRTQYAYGNEVHHIESVEDGGKATENNLILLCPNHHKQANLGLVSSEDLRRYIIEPPTEKKKQAQQSRAIDTITRAIFT